MVIGMGSIGNAVSINVMAVWRARGEKEQLGGSFYKLYKSLNNVLYIETNNKIK